MAIFETTSQEIFEGTESYRYVEQIIKEAGCKKILVVCGSAFGRSPLPGLFAECNIDYTVYQGFQPNPTYENVLEGLKIFRENNCDFLISVGGGSAIDVAKCIKAYAGMDHTLPYISQEIKDSKIRHLAMPTTAGTGSESTHFAVIYYKGEKQSVSAACLLPEYVILEPAFLATLPDYQKASTLMDALCQATESFWSVKATKESRNCAKEAMLLLLRYAKPYMHANNNLVEIFHGANLAGRAINLTQTTLAHAMSYKLTSLYGIAHGHAVALCMPYVWEYLAAHTGCALGGVKKEELEQTLDELNEIYECKNTEETIAFFRGMFTDCGLSVPKIPAEDIDVLTDSVNAQRMKNFPAAVEKKALAELYGKIRLGEGQLTVKNQFLYHAVSDMRLAEDVPDGFLMRESEIERRIRAAGTLLDAVEIYGCSPDSGKPELKKIISELSISLNGYVLKNEIDIINYKNAVKDLKKYTQRASQHDTPLQGGLREYTQRASQYDTPLQGGLKKYNNTGKVKDTKSAAKQRELLLQQLQEIKMTDVFDTGDCEITGKILRGMLCEFDLYLKENHDAEETLRLVFYWEYAKERLYNRKFQKYLAGLRKVQLEMMDEIARVCEKHHLIYVLNYGSLLGAVRHKGFIPWDDDLDICMPREDYEKFLKIGKEELENGCYIYNSEDYKDCWSSIMKVMKRDTIFVRHQYNFGEEDGQRIFIDIWPLDNVEWPGEAPVRRMKKKKRALTSLLRLKVQARCGVVLGKKQKLKLLIGKPFSEQWLIKKRKQVVTQWRDTRTDYWISGGVYGYVKEIMPKSWYLPAVTMTFEGHEYKFPGNYEEVLKHLYGNYMQIPPIDKRYTHAPLKVQMEKDGEILYFNEMNYRKGKK